VVGIQDSSEFVGPTFAPDGKTFFVNIQEPGMTFAIWGPFQHISGASTQDGPRRASRAPGPVRLRELAEAGERYGITRLEAAAFASLGVPLA
jgi:secreted PhoX family phosphatase